MRYFIRAYEDVFGGLDDMEIRVVDDFDSLEEAEKYARALSLEVIETYPLQFEEALREEAIFQGSSLEDIKEKCIDFEVYEISPEVDKSLVELNDELGTLDTDRFIETYCF